MRQLDAIRSRVSKDRFRTLIDDAMAHVQKEHRTLSSATATVAAEVLANETPSTSFNVLADEARMRAEAIIIGVERPAWFIHADSIEIGLEFPDPTLITRHREKLERLARSVGRLDFEASSVGYAGTGWLVDPEIVVTNRHVAQVFAAADRGGGFSFLTRGDGEPHRVDLNFRRQQGDTDRTVSRTVEVREVLYISGKSAPDFAFLRVDPVTDSDPVPLQSGTIKADRLIAAIGYPAADSTRNDPGLMDQIFKGVYKVKRFSPGFVTGRHANGSLLTDYTSLGGNSGSVVLDVESGDAIGLHFAGLFRDTNFAVPADILFAALRSIRTTVAVRKVAPPPQPESATAPATLARRRGYRASFLGTKAHQVKLPSPGKDWIKDIAPVSDDKDNILKYRHFSIVQCASRRLPLFTAVNIDGARAYVIKRGGDRWLLDGRIDALHQIGNEIYVNNPLDRGHMVRRRDPGWGDDETEAIEGETDTFHYTNSAPQHKDLNQKTWVGLEDYVLEHAQTQDFKVSVFTGPVFRTSDRVLKGTKFQIPSEYWKVAVMVNADTGRLSATGYILSQGDMIRDITEAAFVYGEYKTYQVRIALIEAATGLDFHGLSRFDPLNSTTETFAEMVRPLEGPGDIVLG